MIQLVKGDLLEETLLEMSSEQQYLPHSVLANTKLDDKFEGLTQCLKHS